MQNRIVALKPGTRVRFDAPAKVYRKYLKKPKELLGCLLSGRFNSGWCPVCGKKTIFLKTGTWLRDQYICAICGSIPRQRAIIRVMEMEFPRYRGMKIHESSPGGASSRKLQRECENYTSAYYYPDVPPGSYKHGTRCENLEKMTFSDDSFDLLVTQDVMEHVLNPARAFAEIARGLKPEGAHLFTVPYYGNRKTVQRAMETSDGVRILKEKIFHGNPIDREGSLVVTEWGSDMIDFIRRHCGMHTTIYNLRDPKLGLDGEFLEVFVSRKDRSQ